jgi:hypothetical protein
MRSETEIINYLKFFEETGKAWVPTSKSVSIWPIVRTAIYFGARQKKTSKERSISGSGYSLNLDRIADAHHDILMGLGSLSNLKILYFSRGDLYTEKVNNKPFDRFGDPLYYLFPVKSWKKVLVGINSTLVEGDIFESIEVKKSPFEINTIYPENLSQIIKDVSLFLQIQLDLDWIIWYVQSINFYLSFAHAWLVKERPNVVILTCFYSPATYAITYACNRLGIPVFDLQHGQQGDNHLMTMHWKTPDSYSQFFSFLPSGFLTWGESTKNRIRDTYYGVHQPNALILGNPWLDFYRNNFINEDKVTGIHDEAGSQDIVNPTNLSKHRTVLIALQPFEIVLDDFVFDAIRSFQYHWIFRLHPHQYGRKKEIYQWLDARLVGHSWELSDGSDSLYTYLQYIDLTITRFSTVAWESIACKKRVALVDARAESIYAGAIDGENIALCLTADKLRHFLSSECTATKKSDLFFAPLLSNIPLVLNDLSAISSRISSPPDV